MRRLTTIALCAWIATRLAAVECVPAFAAAHVGDLLAWDVAGAPEAWLTYDVERCPTLEITAPDGAVARRSAFLMREYRPDPTPDAADEYAPVGDARLQVRHTPRAPGEHRWRLLPPGGGDAVASGSLTVAAGDAPPGPIRISPTNPRLLSFADGTPYIPLGLNVAWTLPPDRARGFEHYFSELAAAGGNHARVWFASWCGQIESDRADAYRLDHAWIIDRALAAARAHGVRVTLVLDNHHDFVYGKCCPYGADFTTRVATFLAPTPPEQYARRLRYVLARWGADDAVMAWELFNELDMACAVRDVDAKWVGGAAALLKRLDQDHRLRTISWAATDVATIAGQAAIDLTQLRGYVLEFVGGAFLKPDTSDGVELLFGPAAAARKLGKPFCFSEVGYQGTEQDNPGNAGDPDALLLRQQLWAGFLVGGYGSALNWWWDTYVEREDLWRVYRGFARITARLDWREIGLAPLAPNVDSDLRVLGWLGPTQALLWPQHRGDTWHAHLVGKKPRAAFDKPVGFRVSGFRPDLDVTIDELDQVTGDSRGTTTARTDATGKLRLGVPAKSVDTILLVTPAVKP